MKSKKNTRNSTKRKLRVDGAKSSSAKKWWLFGGGSLILIAIIVGLSVGLTQRNKHSGSPTPTPSPIPTPAANGFIGCYQDLPHWAPDNRPTPTNVADPVTCFKQCAGKGGAYAGLSCPGDINTGGKIDCVCSTPGWKLSMSSAIKLDDQQCSGNLDKKSLNCDVLNKGSSVSLNDKQYCTQYQTDTTGGAKNCMGSPPGKYTMNGYKLGGGYRQAVYDVEKALAHSK